MSPPLLPRVGLWALTVASCGPVPWTGVTPHPLDPANRACASEPSIADKWPSHRLAAQPALALRVPPELQHVVADSFALEDPDSVRFASLRAAAVSAKSVDSYFSSEPTYIDGIPVTAIPGGTTWCRLRLAGAEAYAGFKGSHHYSSWSFSVTAFVPLRSGGALQLEGWALDSTTALRLLQAIRSLHVRGST